MIETKRYSDGTSATGTAPLPDLSPDQQAALQGATISFERTDPQTTGRTFESSAFDGARTLSTQKHAAFRTMLASRRPASSCAQDEAAFIKQVAEAMQDAWDDWVGDVGHTPEFLTVDADGQISADFLSNSFAESVAMRLKAAP